MTSNLPVTDREILENGVEVEFSICSHGVDIDYVAVGEFTSAWNILKEKLSPLGVSIEQEQK